MSWKKLNILLPNDDVNSIFFFVQKIGQKGLSNDVLAIFF